MMLGILRTSICLLSLLISVEGWSFKCENGGMCTRKSSPVDGKVFPSLEVCQLMCSNYLNIWPHPTGTIKSFRELVRIDPDKINIMLSAPQETVQFLSGQVKYINEKLEKNGPFNCEKAYPLKVLLQPLSSDLTLNLTTDESYSLEIDYVDEQHISVNIVADTVFGVRHGIETLLQLIVPMDEDDERCLATLSNVHIKDNPVYRHRGLLLDTARNYLPVHIIKRTIDGMAASKMNVFHWHITDSQSFPLESPSLPNMTKYGAYSPEQVYTPDTMKELVEYAKLRGVRILLEIDGPSHAGNGWQWGDEAGLGKLAVCVNKQPWRSFCIQPPCGQLNPANPNLYKVMEFLFRDVGSVLPDTGMFHMGGDEVFIACWNSTPEILEYLKDKPLGVDTFLELWGQHQQKALTAYDKAVGHKKTSIVLWTSHLTQPEIIRKYLPNHRYIIQTWVLESNLDLLTDLLKLGYKVIVSTKDRWYLDHGFWGNTRYYNWMTVYENKMYKYNHQGILGGEVCMWGELVDENNIEPRIWPRAAAAAERLWSNPRSTADYAQHRFIAHRTRLLKLGIRAEAITPMWCVQNEDSCRTYL